MSLILKLTTLMRLGPHNLARVGLYRAGLRSGLHPVLKAKGEPVSGAHFGPAAAEPPMPLPGPNRRWDDALWYFGHHAIAHDCEAPDWFANPFGSAMHDHADLPWWQIDDFAAGDIKGVWELSRLDWLVALATRAAHGDEASLERLNAWLSDWSARNPPYLGPNWKCGQEASVRVMHLVLAAMVLRQDHVPTPALRTQIANHLARIAPTISYAIGQQNNHGTSEAAALFMGGSFLIGHDARANGWMDTGRRWLEERARTLIAGDGSFSQYSMNYHRVMLDSYALAESWRRRRDLQPFSDTLNARLCAATRWLHAMTSAESGDAPNTGANDGARLMPLIEGDYRDHRASVQLAAALFCGARAYGPGPWDDLLAWLGVAARQEPLSEPGEGLALSGRSFDDGGYHLMKAGAAVAVMRYPRFRFRPSQADALHLDLMVGGRNVLRDSGTWTYNSQGTHNTEDASWFGSTPAHNTITFDGRSQMPQLSRFLYGAWLKARDVQTVGETGEGGLSAAAGYTDHKGARHHRHLVMSRGLLVCTDTIGGRFEQACLRWRLAPGPWRLEGKRLIGETMQIEIECAPGEAELRLTSAPESRYYQKRSEVPVLEVRLDRPGRIVSTIHFDDPAPATP
ncbi:MAG: alginate lyase family protein [Brevundimonas sp.]|uniref:heparinase II/III family protein n=1 Tax=Brevundimonas sp. TaxID=1871086 RepID=UPI00391A1754